MLQALLLELLDRPRVEMEEEAMEEIQIVIQI